MSDACESQNAKKELLLFALERLFRSGALFFISLLTLHAAPATGLFRCIEK